MKGKTHDLNHDLTFSAHTINCVCHSITSMFRVLGLYNFGNGINSVQKAVNFTIPAKKDNENIRPEFSDQKVDYLWSVKLSEIGLSNQLHKV